MIGYKLLLKLFPWLLIIILAGWLYFSESSSLFTPEKTIIHQSSVLQEVIALGKLELVQYNFKEITEVSEISREFLRLFKLGPDSKIALISKGQATGCIDLAALKEDDIRIEGDKLLIRLPPPEICNYKLDLKNTRIYSLEVNPWKDEKAFIEQAYRHAEEEVRKAALNSGILEQTATNAELFLKPLLKEISGKEIVFIYELEIEGDEQNDLSF